MAEAAQEADGGKVKKGGNAKILILGIVAIILVISCVVAGTIVMSHKGKGGKAEKKVEEVGNKISLEEFLVNLSGNGDHYLRVTLAVGTKKDFTEAKVKEEIPPIRDAINSVLSIKRLEDVNTEAGRTSLKTELIKKINESLGEEKILKVYILSFATQ